MKLIIKVFLLSAVISLLIKYILPDFSIPPTTIVVLAIVLSPTIVLGATLLWRFTQSSIATKQKFSSDEA